MKNHERLLELAHETAKLALEDSNNTPYPDWDELTPQIYKEILGYNNLIHDAIVAIRDCLEPMINMKIEGVDSELEELELREILTDPRGYGAQLRRLSEYLRIWKLGPDRKLANKYRCWGEQNGHGNYWG